MMSVRETTTGRKRGRVSRARGRIGLTIGLSLLGVLLLVTAVWAATVVTDPLGISGFELYGNGLLWWDGPGGCSGEFPHDSTIRLRGVETGTTKNVARACDVLNGEEYSVVRDTTYVYYTGNGQLMRKAVSTVESIPGTIVPTPGYPQALPGDEKSAALLLAQGHLYWPRYYELNDASAIVRMPTNGSTGPVYVSGSAGRVHKMMWKPHDGGVLVWLTTQGNLWRHKFSTGNRLQLASGVTDFDIIMAYQRFTIPPTPPVTSVYAAHGIVHPTPGDPKGFLQRIDIESGNATVVYVAGGVNQLSGVALDNDYVVRSIPGLHAPSVYIAEQSVTCGDLFCTANDTFIRRHKLPGAVDGGWDVIVGTGVSGGNLRSDDDWLYYISGNSIEKVDTDAPPIELDFQADGLEAIQTTQRLTNNVPLVAGKSTFVRGYAHTATDTTGKATWFPDAQLRGSLNGIEFPDSPLSPLDWARVDRTSDWATLRPSADRSFLWQLPSSWVQPGSLELEMTIDPRGALPETGDVAPNSVTLGQAVQVRDKGSPCVEFKRMHTPITIATNPPGFTSIMNRAKTLMPVEDFRLFQTGGLVSKLVFKVEIVCGPAPPPIFWACIPLPTFVPEPFDYPDDKDIAQVMLGVADFMSSDPDVCDNTRYHLVGMVSPTVSGFNGLATTDVVSLAMVRMVPEDGANAFNSPFGGRTMAHELSHNYGREHIDQSTSLLGCGGGAPKNPESGYPYDTCTIGPLTDPTDIYGFDPLSQQVIAPNMAADLMSYATARWTSDYTWNALLNQVPNTANASMAYNGRVLLVSGVISPTVHMGHFEMMYQMESDSAPTSKVTASLRASEEAAQAAQPYMIRLLGENGDILSQYTLATLDDGDGAEDMVGFVQYIPFDVGTRRIQLVEGDSVLADRVVSEHAPLLTLYPPVIDETAQTMDASWFALDVDRDPLLFTLQYSADDGVSWRSVLSHQPWLSARISTRRLPGSTQARLRLLATDGANTTIAISDHFVLVEHPPEPQIGDVEEGERVAFGNRIYLQGIALDAEEGSLGESSMAWALSGPSPRTGMGSILLLSNLAPGDYTATLTATDDDGMVGTASRHFEVLPLVVPDTARPVIDGTCSDVGYADAALVQIPLGGGRFARAWLLHTGDDLFACFSDLEYGSPGPVSVGLRVDADASGEAVAQPGDIGFFVDQDGIPSQAVGDGSGMPTTLEPQLGYESFVAVSSGGWSAEMRIKEELVGGWDHAARILLTANDPDSKWPPTSEAVQPATWAAAYFGTAPPAPANRAPAADAGVDQYVSSAISESVCLDGGGSFDPDEDAISFAWTQVEGPLVTVTGAGTAHPCFQAAPVANETSRVFRLVVSDGIVAGKPDEAEVIQLPTLHPAWPASHGLYLPLIGTGS